MIDPGVRWQRLSAVVVALALTLAGWFGCPPAPAQAAGVEVSFELKTIKLSGYKKSDEVTITGTVTNTGSVAAYGVQAILWRSRDPIRSWAGLRQVTDGGVLGSRMSISADHYAWLTSSNQAFDPGASAEVKLRATIGELGFDTKGSAFAVGADVIASSAPAGNSFPRVGELRTFVSIPDSKQVPVTSLVLLSSAPTKLNAGLFRDESLSQELSGRLSALLDAAAEPGRSWLIDPALLDEVRDQADGYEVLTKDGRQAGTGSAVAQGWLDRFSRIDRRAGGQTLFADLDLVGAQQAGDDRALERAESASEAVSELADLPIIAVPARAALTDAAHDFLAGSAVRAVLSADTELAGALQGASDRPSVIGVADSSGFSESAPLRHQYALATAVVAGKAGEARLLTTAAQVAADSADLTKWMVRRSLRELLDSAPSVRETSLLPIEPKTLDGSDFERASRVAADFDSYAELAPTSKLNEQADAAVSRLTSAAWMDDAEGLEAQLRSYDRLVGPEVLDEAIQLEAYPRWVMSSRSNQFPITLTNDLADPITVRVVVTCDNPQRLTVPLSPEVTVPPGKSVTVNIQPEASSNGVVTAKAYAATVSGRRVTPDTSVTIEITDLGTVAWFIVIGSGLVLVGATAWRIRQVRRRAAKEAAE